MRFQIFFCLSPPTMEQRSDWTEINQVKTSRNNLFESSRVQRATFEACMSSAPSSSGRENNKTRISAHHTISVLRPNKKQCQIVFSCCVALLLESKFYLIVWKLEGNRRMPVKSLLCQFDALFFINSSNTLWKKTVCVSFSLIVRKYVL